MKKTVGLLVAALAVVIVMSSHQGSAQGVPEGSLVTLYDSFGSRFINPALWWTVCGGFSLSEECATDIRDGHLHLARGLTGNAGSDTGSNYGQGTVFFLNPVGIKSITTDIVVRHIDE
jgi:hypothetical protein